MGSARSTLIWWRGVLCDDELSGSEKVFDSEVILFPSTDFLFRRYQPPVHPLCGAGALKMSLLPFVSLTSPHSLHPLPPSQGGRGSG